MRAIRASLRFAQIQAFRTFQEHFDYKFFAMSNDAWGTSSRDSFDLALDETMSVCE